MSIADADVAYTEAPAPTSKWLPQELISPQPYSMGPLLNWDPHFMRLFPETGSSKRMDYPLTAIRLCLVAPAYVQRAAQAKGERAIMMIRVKGLLRSLGLPDPTVDAP